MRCSVRQVVHHAGVAAKLDIKMYKQRDSVMQENREVNEEVQNPNFSFVAGMLQLVKVYSVWFLQLHKLYLETHVKKYNLSFLAVVAGWQLCLSSPSLVYNAN